jgi:putative MATE family efflux protein
LIAEPLYVIADTAVVGHIGTPELGGLAVANGILVLLYSIFIVLAYGTTATVARLIGAGDERQAAHQAVQSLWLATILGVAVVVIGELLAEPLVRLFGAEGDVADHALVYLRIALLGVPGMLIVFAGTGYLRGLQDTLTPLLVSLGTAAGNFALEIWLIWGLGFGIGASALSTALAQLVAGAIYVVLIGRAVRHHEVGLVPRAGAIGELLVIGRDLLIRTAALRVAFVVATAVATRIGTDELAAYEISFTVFMALALGLDAIAIAAQAMVGRLLGADQISEARAASVRMNEWGVAAGVLCGVGVLALRPWLGHLFTDDDAVLAIVSTMLIYVALLQPLCAVVFTLDGILIGAGDLRYLAVAMVISTAVYLPAALAVLALDLSVDWLWGALCVLAAARLVTLGVRFLGHEWERTGASIRTA